MSYRLNQVDSDFFQRQDKKDSKSKKFPKCYKISVDIEKVNLPIIKDWISESISEYLDDDDIVKEYIYELLNVEGGNPDIKAIQTQVSDFLGQNEAQIFCEKLWKLLIDAQENKDGIPKEILDKKVKQQEEIKRFEIEMKKRLQEIPPPEITESKKTKTNYNRSSTNSNNDDTGNKLSYGTSHKSRQLNDESRDTTQYRTENHRFRNHEHRDSNNRYNSKRERERERGKDRTQIIRNRSRSPSESRSRSRSRERMTRRFSIGH